MVQYCMPPYFSWIEDDLLAVSAQPFHHSHMHYLHAHKIHILINIGTGILSNSDLFKNICFSVVTEEDCPTFEDIVQFIAIVLEARNCREQILVQSARGQGALGVFTACYLAIRWQCPAEFAIDTLIQMRPASFDNDCQKSHVVNFVSYWHQCHRSVANELCV